ncbi:CMRF35-like molecule 3 [Poeciliopsis prolifica]|uniref:CMRF35-like molecule 3 n=1 Tax=Poeciliopsis prolifica TaxID=188132 RepID=UPI0024138C22|nr:CMRF35-like molecule 3 [Poeciliopsis prolifica]
MRTSACSASKICVPVLCLLLLMKNKVDSVDLLAPEEVTATPGGLVEIACQYDLQFKESPKYWCKGSVYELCRILVKTNRKTQSDRYLIADDRETGVFTVTMTSLMEKDEDKYWCVIARFGRNVYKGVRLVITQTATTPSTTESSFFAQQETSLWASLRWFLFLVILGCLAITHVVVRRMEASRNPESETTDM